jgi:hypothetical protein
MVEIHVFTGRKVELEEKKLQTSLARGEMQWCLGSEQRPVNEV